MVPPGRPESKLTQREMDLARSVQDITEEVMIKMARYARKKTGLGNLCLAGGVALNCVGNGRILREEIVDELWIQPAAGDAGGALGVALNVWHRFLRQPRSSPERAGTWAPRRSSSTRIPPYADGMNGSFLGPRFSADEIQQFVDARGLTAARVTPEVLAERVAALLADEKVVGLFQGRMEFGPRALGARSIIGDARSPKMQSVMNLKIKFRESFRPFAPAVLRERVADWFELDADSPYMLLVADVRPDRRLPLPAEAEALWGIEQLNIAAIDHPGRHPRRLLGAHSDRSARDQPAVLRHPRTVPRPDRLSGDRQHVVQRPRRAHRLHPRRRLPLLHAHEHGRAGPGELPVVQGGTGGRAAGRELEAGVRVGLTRTAKLNTVPVPRELSD